MVHLGCGEETDGGDGRSELEWETASIVPVGEVWEDERVAQGG